MVVAHPLSFKTSFTQFNESRQLICNFLLHFCAGRRVSERRGLRLRFVLSEALVAAMAVLYPSPGTAVAPGCRQFRGWIVCVVTVCHLGLCWQAGSAYIVRHFCLSLGPCFTLWKSLPQLREVLSLNADRASCCFRPLQEWGNVWLNVRGKQEEGLLLGKNEKNLQD